MSSVQIRSSASPKPGDLHITIIFMIIYRAVNTSNGKWYLGSTKNLKRRKNEHLKSKLVTPFHTDLRRNPESFIWEIIEEVEGDDREIEQILLDCWFGTEFCYNINPSTRGLGSELSRLGSNSRTEEGRKQGGRKSGPKVGKLTHERYPEKMKENGSKTIALLIERNPNHQSEAGKKGGKAGSREKKKVGGLKCKERGLGMFSIPPEKRSEMSRLNMKKLIQQKWVDPDHPELGAHSAGTLVIMQKRRSFPHGKENRIRVS